VSLAGPVGRVCVSLFISSSPEAEWNPGSPTVSAVPEAGEHGSLLGLSSQRRWTGKGSCLRGRFVLPATLWPVSCVARPLCSPRGTHGCWGSETGLVGSIPRPAEGCSGVRVRRSKLLAEGTCVALDTIPDRAGGSGGPNEHRSASSPALQRTADASVKWRWQSGGQGLLCAEKSG